MYVCVHIYEVCVCVAHLHEIVFLFHSRDQTGYQAWQQIPLSTGPSCHLKYDFFCSYLKNTRERIWGGVNLIFVFVCCVFLLLGLIEMESHSLYVAQTGLRFANPPSSASKMSQMLGL